MGFGLLLLRSAVGILILVQGGVQLAGSGSSPTAGTWIGAAFLIAPGAALLAGFLTPIAASLVGLGVAGGWISVMAPTIFHSRPVLGFLLAIAAAIVLLGPGAFSLDARLFGLREIIIPRSPKTE